MPHILLPIRNLRASVERPVVYSVLRQLMEDTRISNMTPIRFHGDEQISAQTGSTIQDAGAANGAAMRNSGERDALGVDQNRWAYSEQISIEVEEDTAPDFAGTMVSRRGDALPVFWDPALGVSIKPVYEVRDVTVRIKYRAVDKNQAEMWRNSLRLQVTNQEELHLHSASFHYGFALEYQNLLEEIHRLRERVAPYGEDLGLYVSKHLSPACSVVASFNGQTNALVVAETLTNIQGRFDFSAVPEKAEREGDQSAWSVSCVYTFTYRKPVSLAAKYPIMVHNQLIGPKWRYNRKSKIVNKAATNRTLHGAAFESYESDSQLLSLASNDGIQLPDFDEFRPADLVTSSVRCLTGLVSLSAADPRELFGLKDLGSYCFDADILAFLVGERQFITRPFQSVFILSLYRDSGMQRRPGLVMDEQLNIRADADLSLRGLYHVRLGLMTDLSILNKKAIERLRANPVVAAKIAKAIDGACGDKGGVNGIYKNQLTYEEYLSIGLKPDRSYQPAGPGDYSIHPGSGRTLNSRSFFLVETLFVATRPMRLHPSDPKNEKYVATQRNVR